MKAPIARLERFDRVGSTQDVVRGWLADDMPEICVAVADEQTAGRGRLERSWEAPPGAALLVSAGFRPTDLAPELGWRLGALVALAMLEAIEALLGRAVAGLALKWPNDLVVRRGDAVLKLGGVLGEASAADGCIDTAIVGIGVNTDWAVGDYPPALAATMTSLREATGGPVDRERLLEAWLERLPAAYEASRHGDFPAATWADRQVTTGARVEVDVGSGRHVGEAIGVDQTSGALLVRGDDGTLRAHRYGEVVRCRIAGMGSPL